MTCRARSRSCASGVARATLGRTVHVAIHESTSLVVAAVRLVVAGYDVPSLF